MSKAERLAKANFQPNAKVICVFGNRVKPALGAKLEDCYWTSSVLIVQPLMDRINGCLCYLVDDEERQLIGIATIDSHRDHKSLMVPRHFYYFRYETEEDRFKILADCRKLLGH